MIEKPGIGRPRKVKNAKQLEDLIEAYIDSCYVLGTSKDGREYYKNVKPVIMRGFCVYVGICYETLCEWRETRPEFVEPIKRLKQYCHAFAEQKLFDHSSPTVGIIFNLKNNWGWTDQKTIEVKNNNINFEFDDEIAGVVTDEPTEDI